MSARQDPVAVPDATEELTPWASERSSLTAPTPVADGGGQFSSDHDT